MTSHEVALSPEVSRRLAEMAAEEHAPPEAAVLGALIALLGRYAGREEATLVVELGGGARLVRASLAGDPCAREMIRRARKALDEGVALEGRGPRHFLPGAADDIEVRLVLDGGTAPEADFTVVVAGEAVRLVFRTDRFEAGAVSRVAEHLLKLMEGMIRYAGAVSAVSIVGDSEREWILACSNARNVRFDERLPTVVELFEAHVARTPDAPALVDGPRTLTYRELDEAANALCHQLLTVVDTRNPRVAMYLERGADAVVAFVGILKARCTYVPIDTSYPAGRVAAILESADPVVVITREGLVSTLPLRNLERPLPLLLIDGAESEQAVSRAGGRRPVLRPDDIAYTIFTSGSTGRPKGVVVDHRSLANYARAAVDAYGVASDDRVLQGASLGFDLSLEEIVVTLTAGAALVVRSAAPIESIQAFFEECVEQELTVLSITSALWHELTMRLGDGSVSLPPLLKLIILGADVARPDVLAVWQRATEGRVRLVNSYGLTETTIVATVWEATQEPLKDGWRAVPIGRPLRNVSAYVLDGKDELVPVGVAGEVCIGGLAVASHYLGDDALTATRFASDPFLPGRRLYRTGDRGILRASGELEFLGRADYQIKVNGVRIDLGEIEARLREVAGVVEGIVVAQKNTAGETELEAHVMVASGEVTSQTLRAHLERTLPLPTVPSRIRVVDRLPLTPAGKIDRRAIAATRTTSERAEFVPPSSDLEVVVVATIAEVLGARQVGMLDSFLNLGGTSLSAVRAASILGHRLGRRVRAPLFLESKTMREACAELASPRAEAHHATTPTTLLERDAILDPSIVALPHVGRAPLSTVLITGATGYYGAFVLADLLRDTTAHVVCVVRAPSLEAARERVAANLERRQCKVDAIDFARRVTVVKGDIGMPNLGLDPATLQRIQETVDVVFHVGAWVNMVLPYEALRASNVLAVESVLRLATTGRPKTVHHVSTVEVLSDTDRSDPQALCERQAASSPALLREGYGQSKWVAERLVLEARARGVRAYIHRPGRLMGHSRTGAFNGDDFLVRMLEACGQVGAAPILDVAVDVTPVDYASRALVRLAQVEPGGGDAFHQVHPDTMSWSSLVERIARLGYPVRAVPHEEWCSLLEKRSASSDRADFLLYLAGMSRAETEESIRGGYASVATRAALGEEFSYPPLDTRLLATYLQALSREGRFPTPTRSALPSDGHRRASPSISPASSWRPPMGEEA